MIETEDITKKFDAVIDRFEELLKGKYNHSYMQFAHDIYVEARHRADKWDTLVAALKKADGAFEDGSPGCRAPGEAEVKAALEAAER